MEIYFQGFFLYFNKNMMSHPYVYLPRKESAIGFHLRLSIKPEAM